MRTPTLHPVATRLRRITVLALSFVLATGLAACDGAGPTEPDLRPSVDPAPVPLRQAHIAPIAAADVSILPVDKTTPPPRRASPRPSRRNLVP